jgi:hypothetical protein
VGYRGRVPEIVYPLYNRPLPDIAALLARAEPAARETLLTGRAALHPSFSTPLFSPASSA